MKPIDASEWVSPIVVAHKPDQRVKLCVHLCDVNSNIKGEHFPILKGTHNQSQSLQIQIIKILVSIQICSLYLTLGNVKV